MSPSRGPEPSGSDDFEKSVDVIPVVKKFHEIKKFFKTRRAVLEAEPLYLKTQTELRSAGFLGPWTFNATQTLLDALPGMFITVLSWMMFDNVQAKPTQTDPVMAKIVTWLSPLQVPLALLVSVYGIGYACLPSGYLNKTNWHAACRKYLYFDGAYGLWSQMLLATAIALVSAGSIAHPTARLMSLAGVAAFVIAFFWQGIITGWKIRSELYEFDYIEQRPTQFAPLLEPSTFKFFVLLPAILIAALLAILIAFYALALTLARVVHWLHP